MVVQTFHKGPAALTEQGYILCRILRQLGERITDEDLGKCTIYTPGIEWDPKKYKVDSQTGFFGDFLDQKLMIENNIYVVKENGL